MRKNAFMDYLCLILILVMVFPTPVSAIGYSIEKESDSSKTEIFQNLKIKTIEEQSDTSVISINVADSDSEESEICVSVDAAYFKLCKEMSLCIATEDKKNVIYSGVLRPGKEKAVINGLTMGTDYSITAQGIQDILVDHFFGYFKLYEKNNSISVAYNITHETQAAKEFTRSYVQQLKSASALIQEANSEFCCYEKDSYQINDEALPDDRRDELHQAVALLSEYAAASILYEIEPNNTRSEADRIYDDDTAYGTIGYSGDVDFYKVKFTSSGSANFWLGDIPSGKDYDLYLYDASGSLLERSESTSYQERIYHYPVTANTWYYMEVNGYRGSYDPDSYYVVRAKNYPDELDEYEPNDSFSTATSIARNATITTANIHDSSDVDYYKFTLSSRSSIFLALSRIPTECDYDMVLYNSEHTVLASSVNGGNSNESISYTGDAGTYYIKVSSFEGSSSANYRLVLTTLTSPLINVTCTMNPSIPGNARENYGTATLMKYLPIKIYSITSTGDLELLDSGVTNSSGVFSATNLFVGNDVTDLQVVVTFNDNTLSIQKNNGTVYSFSYNIPIGNNSNISISLPNTSEISEEEVLAYGAWKNGKLCLAQHSAVSSLNLGKLVFRSECTEPESYGENSPNKSACYGTDYIHLAGDSVRRDYLDIDVMLHEIGHWLMFKLNSMPSDAGGTHSYDGYYSNGVAYSEGWATFYSCAARNSAQMMDYFHSNSRNLGCNLSNAKYYFGTWTQIYLHNTDYFENQKNELNAGSSLWAYKGVKNYNTVQSIISPTKNSMQEVYNAAIARASSPSEKKNVWTAFNNRGCAFDMTLPTGNLSVYGTTATVSASDDVCVEKIDWYVNGHYVTSTYNSTTDSLDLSSYSSIIMVEARIFDPEGLATGVRPRNTIKYKSLVHTEVLTVGKDPGSAEQWIDFERFMPEDSVHLLDIKETLPIGEHRKYSIHTDGYEDISVYSHIIGGIDRIEIYDPEGNLHDTIAYISPDAPYVIENASAGDWSVDFIAISEDRALLKYIHDANNPKDDIVSKNNGITGLFDIPIAVNIVIRPARINCSGTIYSNDPSVLKEKLSHEKYVIVYQDGERFDYAELLPDGDYELSLIRNIEGRCSDYSYMHIIVDTTTPQIHFENVFETYDEGIYIQGLCSDDTAEVWINGEYLQMSDGPSFGIYMPLDPGDNPMTFELYDRCGNKTTEKVAFYRYIDGR